MSHPTRRNDPVINLPVARVASAAFMNGAAIVASALHGAGLAQPDRCEACDAECVDLTLNFDSGEMLCGWCNESAQYEQECAAIERGAEFAYFSIGEGVAS